MRKIILVFWAALGLSQISCRGEAGADGETGPPGNANVIVSDWKTATAFKDTVIDNSSIRIGRVDAPEFTPEILDKSAVFAYLDYGRGPYPLPFTSYAVFRTSTISYFTQKRFLRITRFAHDGGAVIALAQNIKYRYVIIPKSSMNRSTGNEIDYTNYQQVKNHYQLKD